MATVQRVAIIGAGGSGLPAIKHCLEEGLEPVCFEMRNDIGGMWNYSETVTEGCSSVMKSTVTNISKEMYCYSDFPFPDDFPVFPSNCKILEYLRMYADRFHLTSSIRFNAKILEVKQSSDFPDTGRWQITVEDVKTGKRTIEQFDAVCLTAGHQCMPVRPVYEGQGQFKGQQITAHEYRDWTGLEGKRVVVVGIGSSAADIACELSRVCKQVYLSTRHGTWILSRLAVGGQPRDLFYDRRAVKSLFSILPTRLADYIMLSLSQATFDHELFGVAPQHSFTERGVLINDELPSLLFTGGVQLREDIECLTGTGVRFKDGSSVGDIDAVIYGTGYEFGYRFVKHPAFEGATSSANLYKRTFPPDMDLPTIAAIGYVGLYGSILAGTELQSRWVMKVFKNAVKLPSKDQMWENISAKSRKAVKLKGQSSNHSRPYPWIVFMDEIAEEIGCKPDILKLVLSDPVLAWSLYFGPTTPAQYRLTGPGVWPDARRNILTVWDRIAAPTKTRKVIRRKTGYILPAILTVMVLVVILGCILI